MVAPPAALLEQCCQGPHQGELREEGPRQPEVIFQGILISGDETAQKEGLKEEEVSRACDSVTPRLISAEEVAVVAVPPRQPPRG